MFALFITIGKSLGLGEKVSKALGLLLVILAVIGILRVTYNTIRASGYKDGRAEEKAIWIKAEEEFKARAVVAVEEADKKQAERDAEYAEGVREQREKIDEAVAQNRSPLDAVFPFAGL
jgi:hypothetical protein